MACGLAGALCGGSGRAADTPPPAGAAPSAKAAIRAERTPGQTAEAGIVKRLNGMNQTEISAGKMAQKDGQARAVRDFGATLVRDHTAAEKKLEEYAKHAKIDLKFTTPELAADMARQRSQMDRMNQLKGAEFDRAFVNAMVDDHRQAISFVERARPGVTDPKLNALLGDMLPTLRKHEETASKLAAKQMTASMPKAAPARGTAAGRRPPPPPPPAH
jgi:putative membrane protein